jgi:Mg-chelatase subunit ChlD
VIRSRPRRLRSLPLLAGLLLPGLAVGPASQAGQLRVTLEDPGADGPLTAGQAPVAITGRAEVLGSRPPLEVFLVLDSSKSLRRTDPEGRMVAGARGLAWNLLAMGKTRVGLVDVDTESRLLVPLTSRRDLVPEALERIEPRGRSNLTLGIETALAAFAREGEDGAVRALLLFTDGLAGYGELMEAARSARRQGVAIHTVLLGFESRGASLLQEIAAEARGTFVRMSDPGRLTSAFLDLRATGVEEVTLSVPGRPPVPARIAGTRFEASLPLPAGEHAVTATARGPAGLEARDRLLVSVREPGCAELQVAAVRDGEFTASLSRRHVEIVLDASNSMWGPLDGRPKLDAARQAIGALVSSLPEDLHLGLRAYGSRKSRLERNCTDSERLVPMGAGNARAIREAMAGLQPRGQTPMAYALEQVAGDLSGIAGERSVVLVTDGIESCGGDPVAAARALQADGPVPVHVIGFGLPSRLDEDQASLGAIAEAGGGRFVNARSARELREALDGTVGAVFRIAQEGVEVARGLLGAPDPLRLEAGDYTLTIDGPTPFTRSVTLEGGERLSISIEVRPGGLNASETRAPTGYAACSGAAEEWPASAP